MLSFTTATLGFHFEQYTEKHNVARCLVHIAGDHTQYHKSPVSTKYAPECPVSCHTVVSRQRV